MIVSPTHTSQEFKFFRLCSPELHAFAVVCYVPREPHAQSLTSRTHRACAYLMLPCFVVIRVLDWTRTSGRLVTHARVFRNVHSPMYNPPHNR